MKKQIIIGIASALVTTAAFAQTTAYDANVTPTGDLSFGTGNLNGGFKVVTAPGGALEIGLRGKLDHQNVFPDNGDGVYVVPQGFGISNTRASWNYEFAINVNANGTSQATLGSYTYQLMIDSDPTSADNFTTFNPVTAIGDNTPVGSTVEAQNSENALFAGVGVAGYDAFRSGIYDIELNVLDSTGAVVASDEITVDVVPDATSTMPLLGAALAGLALVRRKIKA